MKRDRVVEGANRSEQPRARADRRTRTTAVDPASPREPHEVTPSSPREQPHGPRVRAQTTGERDPREAIDRGGVPARPRDSVDPEAEDLPQLQRGRLRDRCEPHELAHAIERATACEHPRPRVRAQTTSEWEPREAIDHCELHELAHDPHELAAAATTRVVIAREGDPAELGAAEVAASELVVRRQSLPVRSSIRRRNRPRLI